MRVRRWGAYFAPEVDKFPDNVRKLLRSSDVFVTEEILGNLVESGLLTWPRVEAQLRWIGDDFGRSEVVDADWFRALQAAMNGDVRGARAILARLDEMIV